jgi:hypothetical protein
MRIKKIDLPSIFSLLAATYHRILAVTFILFDFIWKSGELGIMFSKKSFV